MQFHLRTMRSSALIGAYFKVGLFILLLTVFVVLGTFSTSGIALARSSTTSPQRIVFRSVHPNSITCPNTAATQDQTHYQNYASSVGIIPFRIGWEPTSHNGGGYGYCHVLAGHPEVLNKIAYILVYGKVVASSSSSVTIRGTYPDNNQYQIYIVTSTGGMTDGQMRGIVSAYLYTG